MPRNAWLILFPVARALATCSLSGDDLQTMYADNCCDGSCSVAVSSCVNSSKVSAYNLSSTVAYPSGTRFTMDVSGQMFPVLPSDYQSVYVTSEDGVVTETNAFPESSSRRRLADRKVAIACSCTPGIDGQDGVCNPFVVQSNEPDGVAQAGCLSSTCTNCNSQVWILKNGVADQNGTTHGFFQKVTGASSWTATSTVVGLSSGYTPIRSITEWNTLPFASSDEIARISSSVADRSDMNVIMAVKTSRSTKFMLKGRDSELYADQIFAMGVDTWRCTGCADCDKKVNGPAISCEGCSLNPNAGCILTNSDVPKQAGLQG